MKEAIDKDGNVNELRAAFNSLIVIIWMIVGFFAWMGFWQVIGLLSYYVI